MMEVWFIQDETRKEERDYVREGLGGGTIINLLSLVKNKFS